jgi:hypothetical protein
MSLVPSNAPHSNGSVVTLRRVLQPLDSADLTANGVAAWAIDFLGTLDMGAKFDLLIAAEEVQFDELVQLLSAAIAAHIKGLSTEALNATFALDREFTDKELTDIRKEEAWAEED